MNQRRVVASLQVDFWLLLDAVVDNSVEPIALADGGNGAAGAVFEQLFNLVFSSKIDIKAKPHREIGQADVTRRRQDCEDKTALVAKYDSFG